MAERAQVELAGKGPDRRLTPRYQCCGRAQITYLPSDGILFQGRLRNLGLGGCYIETGSPFPIGARTEVLIQANALCFRAMAQVKAVREKFGIGLEFIRLSTGGYRSLAEVLVELEKQQALLGSSVFQTGKVLSEWKSGLLPSHCIPSPTKSESVALVGTIIPPHPSMTDQPSISRPDTIIEAQPEILEPCSRGSVLNLFG